MRAFLITTVMGGLVVVLPLTIFIWLIRTVVRAVARVLDPVERVLYGNQTRMLGFVVDELPDDYLSLFVPTGPNPTNGFVFFCHKDQVTHLKARPEDAVRVVIGVGTGASALFEGEDKPFGGK
ncbi:MAG: hypothetical protein IPH16_13505 [Haliscomenobacter sp.]|nr:hypothetical protein [Haliscomenobacter sp.]